MVIVAGALWVRDRRGYLEGCAEVVRQARTAPGCMDYALSADLVDDDRINVFERWASPEQLADFRGSGPSEDQQGAIVRAEVREDVVAD